MCSPARCHQCGLTTWRGCGMHVDAVMTRVEASQRCTCTPSAQPAGPSFSWFRKRADR